MFQTAPLYGTGCCTSCVNLRSISNMTRRIIITLRIAVAAAGATLFGIGLTKAIRRIQLTFESTGRVRPSYEVLITVGLAIVLLSATSAAWPTRR